MPPLPFEIDIAAPFKGWSEIGIDSRALICGAIGEAFAVLKAVETPAQAMNAKAKTGELSIALLGDLAVQQLNKDFRGKDKPTNVLSFPSSGPAPILGDIVLGFETVAREAAQKQIAIQDHIAHLVIHGFLHLQGYDHQDDAAALIMEALEITALARLNIDNPYEIREP